MGFLRRMIKERKGSALAYTIMTFFIVAVLAVGIVTVSFTEEKMSKNNDNYLRAHYAARSAVDSASAWIENAFKNSQSTTGVVPTVIGGTTTGTGTWEGASYTTSVFRDNNDEYIISAVAKYKDATANSKLSLKKMTTGGTIPVDLIFSAGIYATGAIFIDNSNVQFSPRDCPDQMVIQAAGAIFPTSIPGVTVIANTSKQVYTPTVPSGLAVKSMPAPSGGVYTITQDGDYGNALGSLSNCTVVFDTAAAGHDMVVAVNSIGFNGHITYRLAGTHKLFLYFRGSLDATGNGYFFPENSTNVFLIGVGGYTSGAINIKCGSESFNGYIYAPGKNVTIEANGVYTGAIIGCNVVVRSGASVAYIDCSSNMAGTPLGQFYTAPTVTTYVRQWK